MKKIMVFGTFDIFHPGHQNFLMQAKKLGDYLVVVISRDATVESVKGEKVQNDERKRKEAVEKSGLADEVVLGSLEDKYEVIKTYRPDMIALGYDQRFFVDRLQRTLNEMGMVIPIVRLMPFEPDKYKSSLLKKQ